MKEKELQEQVKNFLNRAKALGLENDFLFKSTFETYVNQYDMISKLNDEFKECQSTITKEYVKGRENLSAHPLITKINQSIDSNTKLAKLLNDMLESKRCNHSELINDIETIYDLLIDFNMRNNTKYKIIDENNNEYISIEDFFK